jgi:MFS family permease
MGLATAEISVFMSLLLFGGVLLQWPIGQLSDRWDRRTVILLVSIVGAALCGLTWLLGAENQAVLFAVVFVYGGVTTSLYSLCVAHSNDYVPAQDAVATASGLLLVYGIGATIGPPVAGVVMQSAGAAAFWLFLVAMFAALALFILARMALRTEQPVQEPFVMLTRTSQSALEALPVLAAERSSSSQHR